MLLSSSLQTDDGDFLSVNHAKAYASSAHNSFAGHRDGHRDDGDNLSSNGGMPSENDNYLSHQTNSSGGGGGY